MAEIRELPGDDPLKPADRRRLILAAVAFQALVLLGTVVHGAIPRLFGTTVWLKVVPVDPRDLFRGDYVVLSYEISRMSAGLPAGTTVYVTLVPDEASGAGLYRGGGVRTEPPEGELFIRGTVVAAGMVAFGIESYYVPEGTGTAYEQAAAHRRLSARVSVSPDGRASLRSLVVD